MLLTRLSMHIAAGVFKAIGPHWRRWAGTERQGDVRNTMNQ